MVLIVGKSFWRFSSFDGFAFRLETVLIGVRNTSSL